MIIDLNWFLRWAMWSIAQFLEKISDQIFSNYQNMKIYVCTSHNEQNILNRVSWEVLKAVWGIWNKVLRVLEYPKMSRRSALVLPIWRGEASSMTREATSPSVSKSGSPSVSKSGSPSVVLHCLRRLFYSTFATLIRKWWSAFLSVMTVKLHYKCLSIMKQMILHYNVLVF